VKNDQITNHPLNYLYLSLWFNQSKTIRCTTTRNSNHQLQ